MYEWQNDNQAVEMSCSFEDDLDGFTHDISAQIWGSDSRRVTGIVEVWLIREEDKKGSGYIPRTNETYFTYSLANGSLEEIKKRAEKFYEENLKGKDLTKEHLLGLKELQVEMWEK